MAGRFVRASKYRELSNFSFPITALAYSYTRTCLWTPNQKSNTHGNRQDLMYADAAQRNNATITFEFPKMPGIPT